MWAICEGWKIRHMVGSNGDNNAEIVHTLCGEVGKPPVDYNKIHLDKCSRCEAVKKRKEATNARNT